MIWIKIGSFTPCICAIGLHLVVYFTEKRALLRSKGFYILNYGWPLVFSLIDLITNLTISEVVWDRAFWVTKDPINPGLALGKAVLVDIVLVLIVVTCILYLVMVRDEIPI